MSETRKGRPMYTVNRLRKEDGDRIERLQFTFGGQF